MGCGKSSIGRLMCGMTGSRFLDLDDWIEDRQGRKIKEIFSSDGEAAFRKMEVEALKVILADNGQADTVLSLGGGTLTSPEAASLVRKKTHCIYLRAGTETLVDNLYTYPGERPMLGDSLSDRQALRQRIESLMSQRKDIYENTAHHIVDIDGKEYAEIVSELKRLSAAGKN